MSFPVFGGDPGEGRREEWGEGTGPGVLSQSGPTYWSRPGGNMVVS